MAFYKKFENALVYRVFDDIVRSDPIHRVFGGQPHECGHYEQERLDAAQDSAQ